jgi:hypothetical protein
MNELSVFFCYTVIFIVLFLIIRKTALKKSDRKDNDINIY